jgi:hypothetical protein
LAFAQDVLFAICKSAERVSWLPHQSQRIVVGVLVSQRARRNQTTRRLRVRTDNFRLAGREDLGAGTDYDLALALDVHPSTLSKLFTGKAQPSEHLIVCALDGMPRRRFEELFEIRDEAA